MINPLLYINEASVFFAILTFIIVSIQSYKNKSKIKLEELLAKGISASAIPTGLALLVCAFKPELLQEMSGFNIHIATAGCALIYISIKAIWGTTTIDNTVRPSEEDSERQAAT